MWYHQPKLPYHISHWQPLTFPLYSDQGLDKFAWLLLEQWQRSWYCWSVRRQRIAEKFDYYSRFKYFTDNWLMGGTCWDQFDHSGENHGAEWSFTWNLRWRINSLILRLIHSVISTAQASASNKKISLHGKLWMKLRKESQCVSYSAVR